MRRLCTWADVDSFKLIESRKISAWMEPRRVMSSDILLRVSSVSPGASGGKNADGISIAGLIIHDPLNQSFTRESCTKLLVLTSGSCLDGPAAELCFVLGSLYGGGASYIDYH